MQRIVGLQHLQEQRIFLQINDDTEAAQLDSLEKQRAIYDFMML